LEILLKELRLRYCKVSKWLITRSRKHVAGRRMEMVWGKEISRWFKSVLILFILQIFNLFRIVVVLHPVLSVYLP